jgi:GNAT superfamily N-acetyltransferase
MSALRFSEISSAGPVDSSAVLALITAQFDDHRIQTPVDRLRAAISAVLADSRLGLFLLARKQGHPVGVAYLCFTWSLEHCGRTAWLEELYVVPSERDQGIGDRLLQAALVEARERGCGAVDLEVEHSQKRAENLYRRAGFKPLTRERWVRRSDVRTS